MSEQTKFTPTQGPWFHNEEHGQVGSIETAHGIVIAQAQQISASVDDKHVRNANAKLMAAAHDLYEACRESLSMCDEAYEATGYIKVAKTSEQRMRLEAALAKARGEAK